MYRKPIAGSMERVVRGQRLAARQAQPERRGQRRQAGLRGLQIVVPRSTSARMVAMAVGGLLRSMSLGQSSALPVVVSEVGVVSYARALVRTSVRVLG